MPTYAFPEKKTVRTSWGLPNQLFTLLMREKGFTNNELGQELWGRHQAQSQFAIR